MSDSLIDRPPRAWFRALRRIASYRPFGAMADRQQADIAALCRPETREALFRAVRNCVACRHRAPCRLWLEEERPGEAYPAFCPNGAYWEAARVFGAG